MRNSCWSILAGLSALALILACDPSSNDPMGKPTPGSGGSGAGSGSGNSDAEASPDGKLPDQPPPSICDSDEHEDRDKDGWTKAQGDCNDCNDTVNPGAYDVPWKLIESGEYAGQVELDKDGKPIPDEIDNDCDGLEDNGAETCDANLEIADPDPYNAARAIDLCRFVPDDDNPPPAERKWGVMSAKYVKADGNPGMHDRGHGLMKKHGNLPLGANRRGDTMLALSSGAARAPGDPGFVHPRTPSLDGKTSCTPPKGFPKQSTDCGTISFRAGANDSAALELKIRVPSNATGFSFDFNFFTSEFPVFICSEFNDFFVALLWPPPAEYPDGNISFDEYGNAVSVNNGFLQVCKPQTAGGKPFACKFGPDMLAGTGFTSASELNAATGWLRTEAKAEKGSIITLRFAIWDTGDHVLDSLVLIDNFQWLAKSVPGAGTTPIQ